MRTICVFLLVAVMPGCKQTEKRPPLADEVAKVLAQRPELVLRALEKNPKKLEALVDAAMERLANRPAPTRKASPAIDPNRVVHGPKSAPITVVAYSDLQCPFCADGHAALAKAMASVPGKVRYVLKHVPLENHPAARPGARYFEAVALQDPAKAYRFQNEIFRRQKQLTGDGVPLFREVAKKLGLDLKRLDADLKSPKVDARLRDDAREADRFGIEATPTFAIDGRLVEGAASADEFRRIFEKGRARK